MVYPFQNYAFFTKGVPRDIVNRFMIMLEQTHTPKIAKKRGLKERGKNIPLYAGAFTENTFVLTPFQPDGTEDVVKLRGKVAVSENKLDVYVKTGITPFFIRHLLLGLTIALILAFLYTYIGSRLTSRIDAEMIIQYIGFPFVAVMYSVKRYDNKATALIEQLIYWLELEEE